MTDAYVRGRRSSAYARSGCSWPAAFFDGPLGQFGAADLRLRRFGLVFFLMATSAGESPTAAGFVASSQLFGGGGSSVDDAQAVERHEHFGQPLQLRRRSSARPSVADG